MRRLLAVVVLILSANYINAQDNVVGKVVLSEVKPSPVNLQTGRLGVIEVSANGPIGFMVGCGELEIFREHTDSPNNIRLRIIGYKPGETSVIFAHPNSDSVTMSRLDIVISDSPPPPPTTDNPDEIFINDILIAYQSAPDATALHGIALIYSTVAAEIDRGSIKTLGGLKEAMDDKAEALGLTDALPKVQRIVSQRLIGLIGDPTVNPEKTVGSSTSKELKDIADLLEEITND